MNRSIYHRDAVYLIMGTLLLIGWRLDHSALERDFDSVGRSILYSQKPYQKLPLAPSQQRDYRRLVDQFPVR